MKKIFLFSFFILLGSLYSKPAQAQYAKYKALYIYNFTKRIDWPEENKKGNFIIGVYGKSDITQYLINISKKKKVLNQPIEVKTFHSTNDIEYCHIILIPKEQSKKINEINKYIRNKATLSISEKKDERTCINFIENNKTLSFQINSEMIRKKHMKLSQSLINLGIEIK